MKRPLLKADERNSHHRRKASPPAREGVRKSASQLTSFSHHPLFAVHLADYQDFAPAPVSLPPAEPEFQSYDKVIVRMNRWLKQQDRLTNVVGLHSVEIPFRVKSLRE